MKKRKAPWASIVSNAIKLSVTAQTVIALRMARLAKGGAAARRESKRMVDEKIKAAFDANADAARSIASGKASQVPARTVALYRKRVQANLRRLRRQG